MTNLTLIDKLELIQYSYRGKKNPKPLEIELI